MDKWHTKGVPNQERRLVPGVFFHLRTLRLLSDAPTIPLWRESLRRQKRLSCTRSYWLPNSPWLPRGITLRNTRLRDSWLHISVQLLDKWFDWLPEAPAKCTIVKCNNFGHTKPTLDMSSLLRRTASNDSWCEKCLSWSGVWGDRRSWEGYRECTQNYHEWRGGLRLFHHQSRISYRRRIGGMRAYGCIRMWVSTFPEKDK